MADYNKEFNDRHRRYFEEYLTYINSECSKRTKKILKSESPLINRITGFGDYKRLIYDAELITEYFPEISDKIVMIDNNVVHIYIQNEMGQSIQISFYQPEYHSNIYMGTHFIFDDYNASCQYDLFPGKNHEYLDKCMSTFQKLLDIWIEEVINKFNDTLGIV